MSSSNGAPNTRGVGKMRISTSRHALLYAGNYTGAYKIGISLLRNVSMIDLYNSTVFNDIK